MNVLEMKGVSYAYEGQAMALENIDVAIQRGEKIAVLGNNGAGKSTFFLCCNGILTPKDGEISFLGRPLGSRRKDLLALRSKVGMVFQEADDQIIASTVESEVSFGPLNLGLPREEAESRVNEALAEMALEPLRERPPHYLSGGEKKRVSIADILAMEPEMILLDEPTASLDPKNTALLEETLARLHERGITLMVSTHDMDFAWRWAERAIVFHQGRILADGPIEEVLADQTLIGRAGLRRPLLAEAAEALLQDRTGQSRLPKNIEEFREMFAGEAMEKTQDAILVVSFGTSYDEARERCIGGVEERIRQAFPGCTVARAFTSGVIIKKLASRGIQVDTVAQALERLADQGVRRVVVQPTHLIAGIEYEKLLGEVEAKKALFTSLQIGAPLMETEEDIGRIAEIVGSGIQRDEDECLVLMGHGTDHQVNQVYEQVNRAFQEKGYEGVFVGTVEAKPNGQAVLERARGYRRAVMAPLMLVAGDHAKNDMAGDGAESWKTMFERAGMAVRTVMKGMGEYRGIQELYVEHVSRAMR